MSDGRNEPATKPKSAVSGCILIASIAFGLSTILSLSGNLTCRVFFPHGSTTRLAFSFGWPFSYVRGTVPGPEIRTGVGPNYVWGHPEMNDDDDIMASIRQRHLSDLALTPWGMCRYGEFHLLGLVGNGLLVAGVWPIVWLICRHIREDSENRKRYAHLSLGARVRLREGGFKGYEGTVEDIDVKRGRVAVRIVGLDREYVVHVTPEQIGND